MIRGAAQAPPFLEPRKTTEKALVAVIHRARRARSIPAGTMARGHRGEAWIGGVSTRRVDDLVQAPRRSADRRPCGHGSTALLSMGLSGIGKSTVSKLCKDIDDRVGAFLDRPLAGEWPYLWLDATYLKQREGGRIVDVAAIIAVAVDAEGRREIVGLHIGPSEAETFWSTFLKSLVKRGLRPAPAPAGAPCGIGSRAPSP